MGRPVRIEYSGAMYHVLARVSSGRQICLDDTDREMWFRTLEETCRRTGWRIHVWVLMDQQYQLLLETPEANLVTGMKWFQGTYTQRFNTRHHYRDSLFQGRYRSAPIQTDSPQCIQAVSTYIHLQPARAKIIQIGQQKLRDYRWSSYPAYFAPEKPDWLVTERVLGSFGVQWNSGQQYGDFLEKQALDLTSKSRLRKMRAAWNCLQRRWYIGEESFREQLLSRIHDLQESARCEGQTGSHDQAEAERMLQRGLRILGLRQEELAFAPKGQLQKQVLAWWLFKSTTVTRRWIADQLAMGCESRVSQAVTLVTTDRAAEVINMKQLLSNCSEN